MRTGRRRAAATVGVVLGIALLACDIAAQLCDDAVLLAAPQ